MSQSHASSTTPSALVPTAVFAGLDVGKDNCQLAILLSDGSALNQSLDTSPQGLAAMVSLCQKHNVSLIVMEATGLLHLIPATELWNAGLRVSIISPRQSSAFAKALSREAKTDRLDALLLARFAQTIQPTPTDQPSERELQLRELAARRRQLIGLLVQEKNRHQQARTKPVRSSIARIITAIEKQLEDVDDHLTKTIQEDPELEKAVAILSSVPGIGQTSAMSLLVALPELGTLNRRHVASLTGLAPVAHDSGSSQGQRCIRGGRSTARTALFMPTMTAIRCNPLIKGIYEHLRNQGKRRIVALVACMRRLVVILNSMIKQNKTWNDFVKTA